jgi:hypothetical protein
MFAEGKLAPSGSEEAFKKFFPSAPPLSRSLVPPSPNLMKEGTYTWLLTL